jgi:kynurenine formamidase
MRTSRPRSDFLMQISLNINGQTYQIDPDKFFDLSIPLHFNGAQPNAYSADRATSKPVEAGALVGDTRRGGSCNFEQYTFIPHCNGTHTECVGHITDERISILDTLKDVFITSVLISVEPESAGDTNEGYTPEKNIEDRLITRKAIEERLKKPPEGGTQSEGSAQHALIIRTLPNNESKKTREYLKEPPPFFSREAMEYIVELGIKHLLVDVPSIDRMFDKGKLSGHRIFWNVEEGSRAVNKNSHLYHTVTEMIFVPDEVEDGKYLLNLQIPAFATDAAPSRPLIFSYVR